MAPFSTESIGSPVRPIAVVLQDTADWHAWIHNVEQRAGKAIWQYIDPSKASPTPHPEEPTMPDQSTFPLDAAGSIGWTRAKDIYNMQLRAYERTVDKLQDINAFIHSTITASNLTYIRSKSTVYDMLVALRQKFAPTDKAREFGIVARYRNLCTWKRNQDVDAWLDQWLQDTEELKTLNSPVVQDERPLWDFLNAVRALDHVFSQTQLTSLIRQQSKGEKITLTLEELIKEFRDIRRYTSASNAMPKGAGGQHCRLRRLRRHTLTKAMLLPHKAFTSSSMETKPGQDDRNRGQNSVRLDFC
jgi:hypothetical protein